MTPLTAATATAYGSVDAITLDDAGAGYTFPTVDIDFPDGPDGVQATAHAVCVETNCAPATDGATVTITGVVVDNPGSGYSTAPNVVIRNGTQFDPINLATRLRGRHGDGHPGDHLDRRRRSRRRLHLGPDRHDQRPDAGTGATATADGERRRDHRADPRRAGGPATSPPGIKKFEDALPGLCTPRRTARPSRQVHPDRASRRRRPTPYDQGTPIEADEYVIGLVQYRTKFSSSLPATLVRGYVQLETRRPIADDQPALPAARTSCSTARRSTSPADGAQARRHPAAVARPDDRRDQGQAGPDRVPQPAAHGRGRRPVPAGRHHADGLGHRPAWTMADHRRRGPVMDEVRNPDVHRVPQGRIDCFKDNRATLHLHGGITPWISDGTPHQWITPAGETTGYPQGVSVRERARHETCCDGRPTTAARPSTTPTSRARG